jgi:aryl-alcohol dehydrogenase-like predicted oxidoreductase
MEYVSLGRTGVKVSQLCLGCMNFGGRTEEATALQIIDRAVDVGINFIDTANVYGHDPANYRVGRGRSEEIVGRALQPSSKRAQIVLATKAHFPVSDDPNAFGNSRRHIIEQCHSSLGRLKTDYIDLYQLHSADPNVPIDETLRALDDLIRAGKVRYVGTSGFSAWQLVESLWVAKEYGLNRFVCEQPPYNLLDRRIERDLVPMALTYGFALINWSPLAGGFLSGKYRSDQPVPENSRFSEFWRGFGHEHYLQPPAFEILRVVEALAAAKEVSPAQVALAWNMQQPAITCPIIGPRSLEQLENCLGATDIVLNHEELADIDKVAKPGRVTVSYYGDNEQAHWESWKPDQYRW